MRNAAETMQPEKMIMHLSLSEVLAIMVAREDGVFSDETTEKTDESAPTVRPNNH